jgi:hypothetical protein
MRRTMLVALMLSLLAGAAHAAGFQDGNGLYEDCQGQKGDMMYAFCVGYVMGALDNAMDLHMFCLPSGDSGVKRDQVISTL